jgi:hypothetical protein
MPQLAVEPRERQGEVWPDDDVRRRARRRRGPRVTARPRLCLALRDGFRGHAVAITVNAREVYRRARLTTGPNAPGETVEVATDSDWARVRVVAVPGAFCGELDIDVTVDRFVAISLIGDGTVSFEPSASPPDPR